MCRINKNSRKTSKFMNSRMKIQKIKVKMHINVWYNFKNKYLQTNYWVKPINITIDLINSNRRKNKSTKLNKLGPKIFSFSILRLQSRSRSGRKRLISKLKVIIIIKIVFCRKDFDVIFIILLFMKKDGQVRLMRVF